MPVEELEERITTGDDSFNYTNKLSITDKMEMVNYGLVPELNHQNCSSYFKDHVLDRIKEGETAIIFPGIQVVSSIGLWHILDPLIAEIDAQENYLLLYPFNPDEKQVIEKMHFSLKFFELSADKDNWYIELKNSIGNNDSSNDNQIRTEINFLSAEHSLNIALPKKIVKSEIHKWLIGQIAESYGLEFGDYEEKRFDSKYKTYKQTFLTQLDREIDITVLRRTGDNGYFPRDITFYTPNEKIMGSLCDAFSMYWNIHTEKSGIDISAKLKQVAYLDMVMKKYFELEKA